jgi:hypothetical protein
MSPVDQLTRCHECDEVIDPLEQAHQVHDEHCDRDDWCYCQTLYVHAACCRQCRPVVIPGQVSLLEQIPTASTRGLPKMKAV